MTGAGSRALWQARVRAGRPLLYAVLDADLVAAPRRRSEGERLLREGVDVLQLRGKGLPAGALLEWTRALAPAAAAARIPLVINDRVDVAALAGVGVHVGSEDLPSEHCRALLGPQALVGVTAHDLGELGDVDPAVADYVGYGAVFATTTRPASSVCGPAALTAAVAASTLPVVAIGGIRPENVDALRSTGVAAVAAASALGGDRASPGAVALFRRALEGW